MILSSKSDESLISHASTHHEHIIRDLTAAFKIPEFVCNVFIPQYVSEEFLLSDSRKRLGQHSEISSSQRPTLSASPQFVAAYFNAQ